MFPFLMSLPTFRNSLNIVSTCNYYDYMIDKNTCGQCTFIQFDGKWTLCALEIKKKGKNLFFLFSSITFSKVSFGMWSQKSFYFHMIYSLLKMVQCEFFFHENRATRTEPSKTCEFFNELLVQGHIYRLISQAF